jgi:hypothetical protein
MEHFVVLPADGTKGEVLLACSQQFYTIS